MKKIFIVEIILLVLIAAAAGYFIWQTELIEPQVAVEPPAATQPAEPEPTTPEPEPTTPEPEPTGVPDQAEPGDTLHTQDAWAEVLEDHGLTADAYFIYDLSSDSYMLRSDKGDTHLYPASITKLFTAYVALLYASPEESVTVGNEIKLIDVDSSVAKLKVGDVLTVEQLIAGMLLPSGNDAAYALSTAIGRKLADNPDLSAQDAMEYFVDQMNEEAANVGMVNSHFVTPDGNHDEGHFIGLDDMVTLGKLALGNEVIARYAARQEETASAGNDRSLTWENTNLMLQEDSEYYCDQTVGLKTGFTTPAGYCVLTAVRIDQRDLLIGVFGCDEKEGRFADVLLLLARNFMLDIYEPVSYAQEEQIRNGAA